jgi:hypothetical protein
MSFFDLQGEHTVVIDSKDGEVEIIVISKTGTSKKGTLTNLQDSFGLKSGKFFLKSLRKPENSSEIKMIGESSISFSIKDEGNTHTAAVELENLPNPAWVVSRLALKLDEKARVMDDKFKQTIPLISPGTEMSEEAKKERSAKRKATSALYAGSRVAAAGKFL